MKIVDMHAACLPGLAYKYETLVILKINGDLFENSDELAEKSIFGLKTKIY